MLGLRLDDVARGAGEEGGDVLGGLAVEHGVVLARHIADVRRRDDVVEAAQRMVPGQRLVVKNIERGAADRSEEHTSELQSLMRISYAVFCLKKKKTNNSVKSN